MKHTDSQCLAVIMIIQVTLKACSEVYDEGNGRPYERQGCDKGDSPTDLSASGGNPAVTLHDRIFMINTVYLHRCGSGLLWRSPLCACVRVQYPGSMCVLEMRCITEGGRAEQKQLESCAKYETTMWVSAGVRLRASSLDLFTYRTFQHSSQPRTHVAVITAQEEFPAASCVTQVAN